jgi:hypothetical protein
VLAPIPVRLASRLVDAAAGRGRAARRCEREDDGRRADQQAQDRAHRIEQTKPVLIFQLVSRHTIENKIMQRASEKCQLEALVIAKGVCPTVRPAPFFFSRASERVC